MPGSQNKDEDPDEIKHDGGHIHHVVGPIAPAGEKTVEVAAFARITVCELDHGDTLRPKEQCERDDPEPDGYAAVGGDRRYDVEIEDGNHKKENKVPPTEDAAQMRRS